LKQGFIAFDVARVGPRKEVMSHLFPSDWNRGRQGRSGCAASDVRRRGLGRIQTRDLCSLPFYFGNHCGL